MRTIKAKVKITDVIMSRVATKNMQNNTTFLTRSFDNNFSCVLPTSMMTKREPMFIMNILRPTKSLFAAIDVKISIFALHKPNNIYCLETLYNFYFLDGF